MGCRVVTASTSLIVVPFIRNKLGWAGYGTWEAVMAIVAVCIMFQGAVTGTLLWRMSQAFGLQDFPTMRRMVRIGVLAILVIFCLLTPLMWLTSPAMVGSMHIPLEYTKQVTWVLPCIVGATIFSGINDVMGMAITGCQRTGSVTTIQAIALVTNYVTAIILLQFGFAFQSLLIGAVGSFVLSFFAYFYLANKLVGGVSLLPALPTGAELKSMSRYGGLLMVGSISQGLRDQTDKLVLARFASTAWVGYYGIAARLAYLVMEVARFFYVPLQTASGAMHAADNWPGVRRLYANMMVLVAVVAGTVTVIVAGFHERLIVMWIGSSTPQSGTMVLILIAGNASAVILTGPGTAICRAIGKVWVETSYVCINLFGNLLLTFVLVVTIGPIGTVIASGSTWAVSAVAFTFILHRVIDLPKEATAKARWMVVLATVCTVGTIFLSNALPSPTHRLGALLGFLPLAAVCGGVFIGLGVMTGLVPKTVVKSLKDKIRGKLKRRAA